MTFSSHDSTGVNLRLNSALSYARRGLLVFPIQWMTSVGCSCRKSACGHPAKHPLTANGFLDATKDESAIREWWKRWPEGNIAVDCGRSGLVVVDVDPRNGGDETWASLVAEYGSVLTDTVTTLTPSGGAHFHFKAPDSVAIQSGSGKLGPGVDVKATGGYVLLPPSNHVLGTYAFEIGSGYGEREIAPLPEPLLHLLTHPAEKEPRQSQGDGESSTIPDGQRNDTLTRFGGLLRRYGLNEDSIAACLLDINELQSDHPLEGDEVVGIAKSMARYPVGKFPSARRWGTPKTLRIKVK
jgi:putative DNA primase/helicase